MSSHHDHDHHHHGHGHHHHDETGELSFEEKLVKIFDHWIKHNESHAQTYLDWGEKARANGRDDIAALLEDIAGLSDRLTEKLKSGLDKAGK
jgi:hypothetical protein